MAGRKHRSEPLTRGEIARAALALVDRDGVEAFSMRRLAEELRVTTMAVYHHFENKAEVMQAAADQVWIEVVTSIGPHDDPVEAIVQGNLTTRRVFRAHADIALFAVAPPTTEDALRVMATGLADQFERAGLTGERAADAYFALATYTLGSALLEAQRSMLGRSIREPVSDLAGVAPRTGGPDDVDDGATYRAVRAAMEDDPDLVRFERGLRQILAGFLSS